ncbi:MAG: heme NO-binding domain-containing protein [Sphingobacteriales bacterium]|nr:heme NO-binding domain-containing protein [Sphingobacteriales bacterium]
MYGIVNKSIEELIVQNYGAEKWELIKEKAGVEVEYFISSQNYSDDITFTLAQTIATELNLSLSDVLKTFGEWWILHTGKNYYGYLLESGGEEFGIFLKNLPSFHNRVMMMYPKLTPPEFLVSNVKENSLHLHYMSKRKGLTDFVYGLISGLGKLFATEVSMQHIKSLTNETTHEIIYIEWKK